MIVYQYKFQFPDSRTDLVQYSLTDFRPIASAPVTGLAQDEISVAGVCSAAWTWGTDGILSSGPTGDFSS